LAGATAPLVAVAALAASGERPAALPAGRIAVLGATRDVHHGLLGPRIATKTFVIDPAESHAVVTVGKAGLFSFAAGHTHEVASSMKGSVELDADDPTQSTIHMEIDAAALQVSPKNEPPDDVPQVQTAMLSDKVLDVEHYPTIVFQSAHVTVTKSANQAWELTVSGDFTLHGTTKPLTFPVSAELNTDRLTAHGQFQIKQSDYGIKPVSVAGVVKVKDELGISYTVVAHPHDQR
jgi:polyisoprenoid-binding protein YceI